MAQEKKRSAARKQQKTQAKTRRSSVGAAPTSGRRSNSKATSTKGRGSSKGGCTSMVQCPSANPCKVRNATLAQRSGRSSKAAATKAPKAKGEARTKKERWRDAPQVLKRPAKADIVSGQVFKRPAMASSAANTPVMKRPSRAASVDTGNQPVKLTMAALAAHMEAHMQPSDVEKFEKPMDMDVESVVTAQLNKWERKHPAAAIPFVLGSTYPASASYAAAARTKPRKRNEQAPPPSKSWTPPTLEVKGACRQKRSAISSAPRPRVSISSIGSRGDDLDDLLPSNEELRLKANVPRECSYRAEKRRASASQDPRSLAPTAPKRSSPRASPTKSRAPVAQSPTKNLNRSSSWAPVPEMCGGRRLSMGSNGGTEAPATPGGATTERMEEALQVAGRILDIRKQRFASKVEWGFAVLDNCLRDVLAVQKTYRALMRPLHPDRAGSQLEVAAAVDVLREAKDLCERALRQQNPPGRPSRLTFTQLCTVPGRRRLKVMWRAPENCDSAPVHRYIVAVFDPSFGKALSIGTLEPDYSQEFKRYLAYDDPELCSYIISEEDLRKMPNLFKSSFVTVQVAAGNNEGQSDWSIVRVPMQKAVTRTSSAPVPVRAVGPTSVLPPSSVPHKRTSLPGFSPVEPQPSKVGPQFSQATTRSAEESRFNRCVDKKSGSELESWLQPQKKELMQAWLKRRSQQISGSKEVIIERLIKFKGDSPF